MHTPHLRFAVLVRLVLAVAVLAAGVFVPRSVLAADERLDLSATVLEEIMSAGDASIPTDLFRKAECAVIVPGLKQGAFVIGAKYGRGFFSCRKGDGWSAPAAVRVEGGSFGFQIGGQEVDVIMLVMNKRGVERLLSNRFTLGAQASIAAGPVGRTATAQTDAQMTAEILSWSRTRGVFAGISLAGATLREDSDSNRYLYRKRIRNREIVTGDIAPPEEATRFMAVLGKY